MPVFDSFESDLDDIAGKCASEDAGVRRVAMLQLAEVVDPGAAPPGTALDKPAASGAVLRTYGIGAQILKDLGVRRMRVLSAPKQMHGISAFDLEVEGYLGEET